MALDQITCSIVSSLIFIALYVAIAAYYKQKPDLAHAVIIAMSCSGVVAAIALGSITYLSKPETLGVLAEQRGSILIGTLAMIWVSIASAYASITHPRRISKEAK